MTIIEYLATLSESEIATIMDVRTGVAATCKYPLPKIYDIAACLVAEIERKKQFQPAHTSYRRFKPGDEIVQPPLDKRKEQVMRELGYNPQDPRSRVQVEKPLVPLPEGWDSSMLKTPDRPASNELKKIIAERRVGEP